MSEPSPRQVLYGLVSAGFWLVTVILAIGAAVAGLVPTWWTWSLLALLAVAGIWMAVKWKRTGPVLLVAIGLFVVWMVGTLIVS